MVEAAAAGVDVSSGMSDLDAPLPNYRFRSMLPKAQKLVNEVQSLGASVLQALEKRDAEELALLRSTQETAVLEAAKEVWERRVEEAKESFEGLKRSWRRIAGSTTRAGPTGTLPRRTRRST